VWIELNVGRTDAFSLAPAAPPGKREFGPPKAAVHPSRRWWAACTAWPRVVAGVPTGRGDR